MLRGHLAGGVPGGARADAVDVPGRGRDYTIHIPAPDDWIDFVRNIWNQQMSDAPRFLDVYAVIRPGHIPKGCQQVSLQRVPACW